MQIVKKKLFSSLLYFLLLFFSILLIVFHKNDINSNNNWLIFYMWLNIFLLALFLFLSHIPERYLSDIRLIIKKDIIFIAPILILAIITRFLLLSSYPYVS